ncbi:myomegalin-like isoform X2 [Spea bombifrons]|uniref:myomegalin-like isoform X2 n=1 Tax=Spea bombifrons TaxID=233779 RepID=UPI00234A0D59|nr:myomegalin-like isoform X2 [Spea bombifrons]
MQVYLKKQTLQLQSELVNTMRQKQELQEKLVVSEATVNAQTDQLEQYRLLFNDPLIEQDNKHVQVDLQDLGYETCGRSEYEVDREETTSPEYEEQDGIFSETSLMEELTSSHKGLPALVASSPMNISSFLQNDWTADWEKSEDVIVLQQHVKDLKSQLQKSQKFIRNLQCQACSFLGSCNCAATQFHLKHSGSFHGSTSHNITDEDDGWQSDTMGAYSIKDLEQLVKRVSMLEAQLYQSKRDGGVQGQIKSANWPGKYDSLIQAQARELSLLRQKLKEGRSVGHILCQHLGDTVKSFEELLRANDIDYYMGQSFREQLAQGSQLADRLNSKLNSKEHVEADDKSRHELLAIRLSEELQQKNKIIESLQSKLEDRSVTPSSSRAISESDQSERTSFVSDDQIFTNEDMEAYSEVVTASDCNQYVCGSIQTTDAIQDDNVVPPSSKSQHHINTPQVYPVDTDKSLQGHCFNHIPSTVNDLPTNDSNTQFKPPGAHPPVHGPAVFSLADVQQELHTLQKQLTEHMPLTPAPCVSSSYFDANTSSTFPHFPHTLHRSSQTTELQASSYCSGGLWDVSGLVRSMHTNINGDASSGSSGYQSASKLPGSDLLKEHLIEIRNLHQHLEKSIYNNDLLREQLKERLTAMKRGNGFDSLPQLLNENRTLTEENLHLQIRINHITQGYDVELKKMQDQVSISRSQLKDLETELEQWKFEVLQLKKERLLDQETNNRLQHQTTLLQQQFNENYQLINTLHSELQLYERLYGLSKSMLSDTRSNQSSMKYNAQHLEENVTDVSFVNKNGCHVIGHFDDFNALKQQILEGKMLMKNIKTLIQSSLNIPFLEIHGTKALDYESIKKLFSATNTLQQILEESSSLIGMFWRAALPSMQSIVEQKKEEKLMQDEIYQLKAKLREQEKKLQEAKSHLKTTNCAKESMEHFIISHLTRTNDVLKRARSNLQIKSHKSLQRSTTK